VIRNPGPVVPIRTASGEVALGVFTMSVIIPTCNRPAMVERLLTALLDQSHHPIEVVVADDGDDGEETRCICQAFSPALERQGVRLRYLKNEQGKSAARTRNAGAQVAQGEILVFIDDDMVIDSGYLSAILQVYEDEPTAVGVGAFHTPPLASILPPHDWRFKIVNTIARLMGWTYFTTNRSAPGVIPHTLTETIECTTLSGATCSYRRDTFGQVMFDERLEAEAFGEDVLLSTRISQRQLGKLYLTPFAKCTHDYAYKTPELRSVYRRVVYFLFTYFEISGYSLGSLIRGNIALVGTLAARLLRLVTTSNRSLGKEVWPELSYTARAFLFALRHLDKIRGGQVEDLNNELARIG
jgi:GT2 family glycosyltransferase